MRPIFTALMILMSLTIASSAAFATPFRVIIIRHAEKPDDDENSPDLSPVGYQRAQALTRLFDVHPEYAVPGLPAAYIASLHVSELNADRSRETLAPLAAKFGQEVLVPFSSKEPEKVAQMVLESPDYDGKVVMIAWAHSKIPTIAKAFGCTEVPKKWDGKHVYDRVWILDFTDDGIEFSDRTQNLMPGDSDN